MGSEGANEYLELAVEIARAAGEMIVKTFHEEKTYDLKSNHADMCTETDRNVEKMVFIKIREKYPHHRCIGEESQSEGEKVEYTDDVTWIVDPIDGTTNFIHRYEYVCISIGVWKNKKPVVGVIYNPVKNEMFSAQVGGGAFCNGQPIHVSNTTDLKRSLITTECHLYPTMEQVDIKLGNMRAVVENSHGIRGTGSSALSMTFVATGAYDGHFEFGLHCWDMAAGALLVTEAGGVVMDIDGELLVTEAGGVVMDTDGGPLQLMARRLIAACSRPVADQLAALLTNIPFKPDCSY